MLAGRSPDGAGPAIVVFEASSEDQARRFMENGSDGLGEGGVIDDFLEYVDDVLI